MSAVMSPSNALPHSQRLRLIRSIRKLGDLLTETSLLVEPPQPRSSHSRGASSISSTSPVTMIYEDPDSPSVYSPTPTPTSNRFFSLRLPTFGGDRTPLSPTFSLSLNSPSTPVIDPETLKERKLAKVVQTLGENVPPELVFPPSTPGRKGRKRASTVSVPEYTSDQRAVLAAGATVVGRRHHGHGCNTESRTMKHTASSTSLRGKAQAPELEPFSYPSLVPVPVSQCSTFQDIPPLTPGTDTTFSTAKAKAKNGGMHRKELGWSGEWSGSVQNMEEVVRGLRGLRMK
ncbi:hypothetical protein C8R43DRAFT_996649 [Mycena crocata]|nr:hypothetical protein C8R43DRAFT_996649 [Mycena crocata]